MASYSTLENRIAEITTCPICTEKFKSPRSLPCLHSFCLECLENLCSGKFSGADVSCPVCRTQFQIPSDGLRNLKKNFFLENLIDVRDTASSAGPAAGRGRYCENHPAKQLELYCFDCGMNICSTCLVDSHRKHSYDEIERIATGFIKSIQDDIQPFHSRINSFETAITQVEAEKTKFTARLDELSEAVRQRGNEIKRTVDEHVSELLQELDNARKAYMAEAEIMTKRFELAVAELERFEIYCKELTTKGSPSDVTHAANDLRDGANKLLMTYISPRKFRAPVVTFLRTNTDVKENVVGVLQNVKIREPHVSSASATRVIKQPRALAGGHVCGLTSLNDELCVLHVTNVDQLHIYSTTDETFQRHLNVPGLGKDDRNGLTSCVEKNCLYVSDSANKCIHTMRLSDGEVSKLADIPGEPVGLSVIQNNVLLVTYWGDPNKLRVIRGFTNKLLELSSDTGQCLRRIKLQSDIERPWHAVQLSSEQYVVCHGGGLHNSTDLHRVCVVGADGRITQSYGGRRGAATGRLDWPCHVAVDKDGKFIYVADRDNHRVVQLSAPSLQFESYVIEKLPDEPRRLHLDHKTQRLYVGQQSGNVTVVQL